MRSMQEIYADFALKRTRGQSSACIMPQPKRPDLIVLYDTS